MFKKGNNDIQDVLYYINRPKINTQRMYLYVVKHLVDKKLNNVNFPWGYSNSVTYCSVSVIGLYVWAVERTC